MWLMICRFATNVYYDVSLPEESVSEYNHIYQSYWGFAADLDFIMADEENRVCGNLLRYRHDPYMFHQVYIPSYRRLFMN